MESGSVVDEVAAAVVQEEDPLRLSSSAADTFSSCCPNGNSSQLPSGPTASKLMVDRGEYCFVAAREVAAGDDRFR